MEIYERVNSILGTKYSSDDSIDWSGISSRLTLTESFINEFSYYLNWAAISSYQVLSEEFIENFRNKVHWGSICKYQKISEEFIRRNKSRIYWRNISERLDLSEDFIIEFKDLLDLSVISSRYKNLSESIKRKLSLNLNENLSSKGIEYISELAKSSGFNSEIKNCNEEYITGYLFLDNRLTDEKNNKIRYGFTYDGMWPFILSKRPVAYKEAVKCRSKVEDIIEVNVNYVLTSSIQVLNEEFNYKLMTQTNRNLFINSFILKGMAKDLP